VKQSLLSLELGAGDHLYYSDSDRTLAETALIKGWIDGIEFAKTVRPEAQEKEEEKTEEEEE